MCEQTPSGWKEVTLGQLVKGFRGVSYRPENLFDHASEAAFTLLRATNIQNGKLTFDDVQFVPSCLVASTQILESGDIAVCMSNGSKPLVGKSAQYSSNNQSQYTVGAFCSIFKPIEKQEADFVFHLFRSQTYQQNIDLVLSGSAINNLKNSSIESAIFNVPTSKDRRKKIATILSGIDSAIEKTEALIAKYQQIKAGLMHDLFTRGVLPNGQLRPPREQAAELYQETAIGWAPREWDVSKVENVLHRIIDYRGKTPEKTVSGIPLITAKNVRMGYIDPEPREFIAEAAYVSWMTRGIPNKGDVLFTTEAPLGNVAQVPSDDSVAFAQRAIILQPSEFIDATFLAYRLMTEATQNAIARLASGSTALGVKQSEFRKVCIAFPVDRVEQKEITRRLQALDGFLNGQHNARRKLQNQKLGLMQDLLTGKVPVQVDEPEAVNG